MTVMLPSSQTSPRHYQRQQVNLLHLAAAAIAATLAAAQPIREFSSHSSNTTGSTHGDTVATRSLDEQTQQQQERAEQQPHEREPHLNKTNARWKDDGTIVTDADYTAQGCIVRVLRKVPGEFVIIGEESAEEMEEHLTRNGDRQEMKDMDVIMTCAQVEVLNRYYGVQECPLAQGGMPETLPEHKTNMPEGEEAELLVDASRVRVFVDPLDGTKSYENGDYDAVTILIAIILDGKPHFGVITKPFGCNDHPSVLDTNCVTLYGGPLLKQVYIAGVPEPCVKPPTSDINLPRAVISSSRSQGVVQNFVGHLAKNRQVHSEPLQVSGAGEKSLRLIVGTEQEALWFFPKAGTARWDVAASDALLRAMGGRLTDKYGRDLDYSKSREEAENLDGIIASSDAALHEECIRLFNDGSRNWELEEYLK